MALSDAISKYSVSDQMQIKLRMKTFYLSHMGGSMKIERKSDGIHSNFCSSKNIFETAMDVFKTKFPYDLDGIIFTPLHSGYFSEKIYKWKDRNTMDFFYENGRLFIAGNTRDKRYINMAFDGIDGKGTFMNNKGIIMNAIFVDSKLHSDTRKGIVNTETFKHFDGHVVECGFKKGKFYPIKRRDDKMLANNISVVNDAWESTANPLSLQAINDGRYTCIRKYHNSIKRDIIMKFMKDKEVLDIGSGAGGDIQKYIDARAKRVVGVDIVPVQYKHPHHMTFIQTNSPQYDIQDILEAKGISYKFDVVNVQFAAHYFFESIDTLNQFCTNVFTSLRKGGLFVMTVIDGRHLHDIFMNQDVNPGNSFAVAEKTKHVFSVKRLYESFMLTGSSISVMLHGTKYFNKPSMEYAVNISEFIQHMKKFKMSLVSNDSFRAYSSFPEHDMLNPGEQAFSYLNKVVVFRRD